MLIPSEERVDRFIVKEEEETPLPIIPSGSLGVTVTEANIATLFREVVTVKDDK